MKALVTGASGFLGRHIVQRLVDEGFSVRALTRKKIIPYATYPSDVEVCTGDVTDRQSLRSAFEGIDIVVHAAADTVGTEDGGQRITLGGTLNVLEFCDEFAIKSLIYISSCSVYETASVNHGELIDENAQLEPYPEKRGAYSHYKLLADEAARTAMSRGTTDIVVLRPATIYDDSLAKIPPNIGHAIGKSILLVIGSRQHLLSLVHVENVAESVLQSIKNNKAISGIFNVVDNEGVTKGQYIENVIRKNNPHLLVIYLPFFVIHFCVACIEKVWPLLGMKPPLSVYRLKSSHNSVKFDGAKIMTELKLANR